MSGTLDLSRYRGAQSASINSGGASVDRKIPDNDHNPLKNAQDWNDPVGYIGETARDLGLAIRDGLVNVIKELTGLDLSTLLEVFDGIDLTPGGIIAAIEGLLEDVPVLGDIIRIVKQLIFGGVPVGALTPDQPNILTMGDFAAGSIAGGSEWTIDAATSRSGDGTGSVTVTCNGKPHALRTGAEPIDRIPVSVGQKITPAIYIKHQGYSGSGAPIQWQLVPFKGTEQQPIVNLESYAPSTADADWPGHKLSGDYTVPEGVTGVQFRIYIAPTAAGGQLWFDDAEGRQAANLQQSWIEGLSDEFSGVLGRIQAVVDTFLAAITGLPVIGGTLTELLEALHLIPPSNVTGAAGPATIFDSIFGIIDALLGGLTGTPGASGGSLSDVTNVAGQIASQSAQGAYAWQLANMLNNTPVARGMLSSGRANYDLTSANTFLATTQSAALSVSFGLLQAMPIGVISWYGYGSSGITAFYVNVRKVNLTTGARELVHHSANIVGTLVPGTTAANADWMFYSLPQPLAGNATDYFYVEFVPVGGTHNIRGMNFADSIKDHPLATVPCYGTTVNYSTNPNAPAASLTKATSAPAVAWVEFAPALGDVADHHEPAIFVLDDDGESIPIPSWCNRLDAIPLSRGGDGHDGLTLNIAGAPGQPGQFAPVTWSRGVHFSGDATLVTYNVLSDGSAKVSIPGQSTTAAPGANGAGTGFGINPTGHGPGVLDYNGQKYLGGADQKTAGGNGQNPGGGGAGGNGLFFQPGGKGGKPVAWICFRQTAVDNENTSGDTTAPTAPTVEIAGTTFSSITIAATGSLDE